MIPRTVPVPVPVRFIGNWMVVMVPVVGMVNKLTAFLSTVELPESLPTDVLPNVWAITTRATAGWVLVKALETRATAGWVAVTVLLILAVAVCVLVICAGAGVAYLACRRIHGRKVRPYLAI